MKEWVIWIIVLDAMVFMLLKLVFLNHYLVNCLSLVSAAIIKYHRLGSFKREEVHDHP